MSKVLIPDTIIKEIENLITDDAIKREFDYESVDDYIIQAIEDGIQADKDCVGIPIN